ncbi:MAG: lipopolysaccharide assembly protein LapA domain-containing protein [Acidimicrobiia bacterium]
MAEPQPSGRQWDITPKQILIGVLVLLLVLFAALNTHQVNLDFIVGDADLSLIFVITASALIGFALGWIVKARADRD